MSTISDEAAGQVLTLPLKAEYFNAIERGEKSEEYRLASPYWTARLEGRTYAFVVLTLGYPRAGDADRRIIRPWRGYVRKIITHPHFGPAPVEVFAIDVSAPEALEEMLEMLERIWADDPDSAQSVVLSVPLVRYLVTRELDRRASERKEKAE